MMKRESVPKTLADLNLTRLLALGDFIAELYAFSLYIILPDRQYYFAQPHCGMRIPRAGVQTLFSKQQIL
jgi:hypothetical protein